MPIDIFLSYRRNDTAGQAGRLFDRLAARFGEANIFMDVQNIEGGSRFEDDIVKALWECRIMLVAMGPTWLTAKDHAGRRTLDDPADIVRDEVSIGLDRNILVIPILLDGAATPMRSELPEQLQGLASRNSVQISNARFRNDYGLLEELIARGLRESAGAPVPEDIDSIVRKPYSLKSPCSSDELEQATLIAGHFFPGENIDPKVVRAIHERSPNSFLALVRDEDKKVIAYADVFAIREEILNKFGAGVASENDLSPQDFLPLDSNLSESGFGLYIGAIAIREDRNFEMSKCAAVLTYGLTRIGLETAFRNNKIRRVYAVALSAKGTQFLNNRGFSMILARADRKGGDGDLYCRVLHRVELEEQLRQLQVAEHLANIKIQIV